jgi:hypothetical protein
MTHRFKANAKAATTPRASAIPPAAMTGTLTASATCGTAPSYRPASKNILAEKNASVPTSFVALGDDSVTSSLFQPARFIDRSG